MENQHTDDLSRILRTVEEILEIVHFMKDHRSQLEGDPILDFAEVCQLLRQSERQVRRFVGSVSKSVSGEAPSDSSDMQI